MNPWPDLRPILKGINWALIGGVATRAYMAERMTKDMDIIVHSHEGETVIEKLKQVGYRVSSKLAVAGYLMISPEGVELDVYFGDHPWLKEALANPSHDPAGYPVLGLPYLVVLKLAAARAQDWADVARMLGWASDADLDEVRAVAARYAPQDLEDLESLIFLGKKEQEIPPSDETDKQS